MLPYTSKSKRKRIDQPMSYIMIVSFVEFLITEISNATIITFGVLEKVCFLVLFRD